MIYIDVVIFLLLIQLQKNLKGMALKAISQETKTYLKERLDVSIIIQPIN